MIGLIFLDIDGTLVGSKGHVEDCVWQAVEKAQEAGIKLSICTGRPCFGVAQKIAERVGPNTPHIFQNGAQIARASGEPIKIRGLKEATTRALVAYAREQTLTLELYTPNNLYIERKTPMSEQHAKMIGVNAIVSDLSEVIKNEPVVRAQWIVTQTHLERALAFRSEDVSVGVASSPALKTAVFVSLTRSDVSKGSAAEQVAQSLNIELADAMGVGDSSGDLPLLERVGHPVVMANSVPELLDQFEVHAGDVDNCGVVAAFNLAMNA